MSYNDIYVSCGDISSGAKIIYERKTAVCLRADNGNG